MKSLAEYLRTAFKIGVTIIGTTSFQMFQFPFFPFNNLSLPGNPKAAWIEYLSDAGSVWASFWEKLGHSTTLFTQSCSTKTPAISWHLRNHGYPPRSCRTKRVVSHGVRLAAGAAGGWKSGRVEEWKMSRFGSKTQRFSNSFYTTRKYRVFILLSFARMISGAQKKKPLQKDFLA